MLPRLIPLQILPVLALLVCCAGADSNQKHDASKRYRAIVQTPTLTESSRAWIDSSGKHAFVGTLKGRTATGFSIQRADQKQFEVPPSRLALKDRVYALEATEPRVTKTARVLLGKVVKVLDGDTVRIETLLGETMNIRLNGIDAPEKKQEFCDSSIQYLEKIKNRLVRIEYIEPDSYGRILGQIYLLDRWVNYEMVLAGYAHHYTKYSKDQRLAAAEEYAQDLKRGIWSVPARIAPWDWRNGVRVASATPVNARSIKESDTVVFITTSGSHYHTAKCRHAVDAHKIPLSRATSAYKPCSICNP